MSSQDVYPGDAMDSQPEVTTPVAGEPTPETDTFTPGHLPVGIPIPLCSRHEFIDVMNKFYTKASTEQDGFRLEDAFYVMDVARSARHRIPRHEALYFVDHPARQEIVIRFYRRLNVDLREGRISPEKYELLNSSLCWAFLQIANDAVMATITTMLDATALPSVFTSIEEIFSAWSLQFRIFFTLPPNPDDVRQWTKILGSRGETILPKQAFESRKNVKDKCRKRDDYRCVITGSLNPEVAHIYPMSGINNQYRNTLKVAVATIWGQARADAIYARLFSNGVDGTDWLGNMLCLSATLHDAWEKGDFALCPRPPVYDAESGKWKMELIFHWMVKLRVKKKDKMSGNFQLSAAATTRQQLNTIEEGVRAVNAVTNVPILDGHIITIRADEKEELPDFDITMLQLDVIRMAALCGGAEPDELEDCPSESGDSDAVAIGEEPENVEMIGEKETAVKLGEDG